MVHRHKPSIERRPNGVEQRQDVLTPYILKLHCTYLLNLLLMQQASAVVLSGPDEGKNRRSPLARIRRNKGEPEIDAGEAGTLLRARMTGAA